MGRGQGGVGRGRCSVGGGVETTGLEMQIWLDGVRIIINRSGDRVGEELVGLLAFRLR